MDPEKEYLAAQTKLLSKYGVNGESRFVDLSWRKVRTHLVECGQGSPLLFVIGGGGFSGLWTPLLARIPGHKLYAVDRPGFGLTDPVEHRTDTLRNTAVSFLASLLDALEIDRATLIANSMGSLWSFWLALDKPERVARMIHIGCPAHLFGVDLPVPLRLLGVPGVGRVMMSLMPPSPKQARTVYGSMNEGDAVKNDSVLERAIVTTARLPSYGPALRSLMHAASTPLGTRQEIALTEDQVATVQHPTQIIWGAYDPIGPETAGRRLAGLMPHGSFASVPGGHLPWLDAPEQVAEIVSEFLHRNYGSAVGFSP